VENIDWSKAPEGAEFWCDEQWFKVVGGEWFTWYPCAHSWAKPAYKSPGNFSWWESAVERPQPSAWNGQGLPPVGAVCDVKQMARGAEREWFKAKVLYSSPYTVVLDDYQAGEFVSHPCTLQFRPIRTPEQKAADEREAAIDDMIDLLGKNRKVQKTRDHAGTLYDAGYRRP